MADNDKVKEHIQLFRDAEAIYKDVQLKVKGLDTSVLNEFRYAGRHQASMLEAMLNGDDASLSAALETANRAVACAINDSIDGVIIFAKEAIRGLHESFDKCDIAMYYGIKDYEKFWTSIQHLESQTSVSRNGILDRLNIYKAMFASQEFKQVIDFCAALPLIESKLVREYRHRYAIEAAKEITVYQWLVDRSIQLLAALAAIGALGFSIYSYKNPPPTPLTPSAVQEVIKIAPPKQ